jgi:hypothetical protein
MAYRVRIKRAERTDAVAGQRNVCHHGGDWHHHGHCNRLDSQHCGKKLSGGCAGEGKVKIAHIGRLKQLPSLCYNPNILTENAKLMAMKGDHGNGRGKKQELSQDQLEKVSGGRLPLSHPDLGGENPKQTFKCDIYGAVFNTFPVFPAHLKIHRDG